MAEELGKDYDSIPIAPHGSDGSKFDPDFLTANPNARVPAIDDDSFVLWESMAINLYLAKKYGGSLYPDAMDDEASAWQWSFWALAELDKQFVDWALHDHALPLAERDAAKARAALKVLERPLKVLEGALSDRDYLLGDSFTVADLNVASVMYRALWMDLDDTPAINDWFDRCWARPAARRARDMRGEI